MYNWSTDEKSFTSKKAKQLWQLEQKLNFGLGDEKLSKQEIIDNWQEIKEQINPYTKRLLEFLIWENNTHSPPISSSGIGRKNKKLNR